MSDDRLQAVLEMIQNTANKSYEKIDNAERFARESESLRVTGESSQRLAKVTVDGVGQMVDLDFSLAFSHASSAEVRTAVLEAHNQAKQKLSNRIRELGTAIYGPDSPTVDMMAGSYDRRFGTFDEEERR